MKTEKELIKFIPSIKNKSKKNFYKLQLKTLQDAKKRFIELVDKSAENGMGGLLFIHKGLLLNAIKEDL